MTGNRMNDLLALSIVPRWSIVDHTKPQCVSDHVFRVLVIALELTDRLKLPPLSRDAMLTILYHDADESRTGDVPASAKSGMAIGEPVKWCPWLPELQVSEDEKMIIHLADLIEALTFIHKYGTGPHAKMVERILANTLYGSEPQEFVATAVAAAKDIQGDVGR